MRLRVHVAMSVTLLVTVHDFEGVICSMALCKDWKTTLTTPSIGDHPNQPSDFNFNRREFGQQTKVKRSFKAQTMELAAL